jgi:filamentous hemagglutinin family protein
VNRAYRLVWSRANNAWVVASEITKGRGKSSSKGLLAAALMLSLPHVFAFPIGGQVVSGIGTIAQSGNLTTINQGSQNLSVNWKSFNVGSNETVNFLQPSASAIAVNRIYDTNGSQILGHLNANGQVWLINPNGILFGKSAQVNVGGLVASTLDSIQQNGSSVSFSGKGAGRIINQGTINGHYVALIGNTVSNTGMITANLGSAALGAGSAVTLTFSGNDLVHMQVDRGVLNALVSNGGIVQADGGYLILSAGAKDELLASVVNNTGIVRARTVEDRNGDIVLLGGMKSGTVNVSGTIDASAPNGGNGGFIETSAANVHVSNNAKITTLAQNGLNGSWLIDPVDFTIAASGGDMTGAAVTSALAGGNFTILSSSGGTSGSGNINVDDTVSWSVNTLTLNAQNNININSVMNGSGTASLALQYGQGAVNAGNTSTYNVHAAVNLPAGNYFSTKLGSDGAVVNYTVITSLGSQGSTTGTDLQGMQGNLSGNYALGANIDASGTSSWNSNAGFTPIGNNSTNSAASQFTGIFDGLRHTINNLTINLPSTNGVGLFGYTGPGSVIRNVGLTGGIVNGANYVGGLVGYQNGGTISDSYSTGSVSGGNYGNVGGLVGVNKGTISNSFATGSVTAVFGSSYSGGLVGMNYGTISNSYATGSVTAGGVGSYGGGLVGGSAGTISDSYATGSVSGGSSVGGLAGHVVIATISNSYATGSVTGSFGVGGLVGLQTSSGISNSYWDTTTSGQATSAGGTPLTTTQMQTASNFSGFTFTTTPGASGNNWVMVDSNGTLNNSGGALGATFPMLASEYSTTVNNAHQLQLMAMNLSGTYTLGQNIDASNTATALKDIWSTTGGFVPVGNSSTPFTGSFDGLNHTISNLTINLPTTSYVGLFGITPSGSLIQNVGLVGGSVSGGNYYVGFLVGYNNGTISNSYATGAVSGSGWDGGLVGANFGSIGTSYATGAVTGSGVGGLVGENYRSISNSYAMGRVTGSTWLGGLVGANFGSISASFWNMTANLALAGVGSGTLTGTTGLHAGDMMLQANFTSATAANGNVNPNWDFANTWVMYDGHTTPLLRSFMTALTVTANNASKTYDGAAFSGGNGASYSVSPNANLLGTISYGGSSQGAVNAGSYAITPSGLYSNQQGYIISYANGSLTVNQRALTGSIASGSTTYGSSLSPGAASFTNEVTGDNLTAAISVNTSGNTSSSGNLKAGSYTGIEYISGLTGTGAGNYTYSGITGNYTVSKLALTGALIAAVNTTYGTSANSGAVSFGNVVGADSVSSTVGINSPAYSSSGNLKVGSYTQSASATLGGTDAGNYTFAGFTSTANYVVNKLALAGSIASGSSTYGSSLNPGVASFTNAIAGDSLSATVSVNTAGNTSTSGNLKDGSYTGIEIITGLSGSDASNYTYSGITGDYAVSKLALTGALIAAVNTTYGTSASAGAVSFGNVVGSDSVTAPVSINSPVVSSSGNLEAGSYTQSASVTLGGADAGNYTFAGFTSTANYVVNKHALSVSRETASNKIYDGTTTATLTGGALVGVVSGDTVMLVQAGSFATKNVGNSIAVTASDSISGTDSGNYVMTQPTGLSANISPAPLTVSGLSGTNRTYNGTTADSLFGTATLNGLQNGETLILGNTTTGTLASANAGSEAVTTNITISNGTGNMSNYTLAQPTLANVTISPAPLTVTGLSGTNRTYNGSLVDALSGTATLNGLQNGETLNLGNTTNGTLASANAGSEAITTNITIANGTGLASNYTLAQPTLQNVTISQALLAVTGEFAASKVYDGTTAATLKGGTLVGLVSGDSVTLSQAGSFASKNVGNNIAVTASDSISGASAGNYILTQPNGLSANITPATLTYVAAPFNTMVGEPITGLTGSVTGFVGNDSQANSTTGNLAWSTTATSSSQPGQYPIDGGGLSAANYVFVEAQGNATALTLQPGSLPGNVQSITTQNDSNFTHLASQPLDLNPSTTITPANSQSTSGSGSGESPFVNVATQLIAGTGSLHIVNGGVNTGNNQGNQ